MTTTCNFFIRVIIHALHIPIIQNVLTNDSIVSLLCEKNKANKRMEKERHGFVEDREVARRRIMSEYKETRKRKQTCSEQRPPEPTIVSRLIHLMHCRTIINFFIRLRSCA